MQNFDGVVNQLWKYVSDMKNIFDTGAIWSSDVAKEYMTIKDNCYTVLFRLKQALESDWLLDQCKHDVLRQLTFLLQDKNSFSFVAVQNIFEILSQSSCPLEKKDLSSNLIESKQKPLESHSKSTKEDTLSWLTISVEKNKNNKYFSDKHSSTTSEMTISFWKDIFSLFDMQLDEDIYLYMNARVCHEILDTIDWKKYTNEQLSTIISTLQYTFEKPILQEFSAKTTLKILIKEIQEILSERHQLIADHNKQLNLLEKRKLLAETFVPLKDSMWTFVEWIVSSVEKIGDISSYYTWKSIKKDSVVYKKIVLLHTLFLHTYSTYVADVGYRILKDFFAEDTSFAALLQTQLSTLDHVYKAMPLDRFFLAIKQGYLLGDMYEFLLAMQKHIPEISYADSLLQERLDTYSL